MTTSTPTTSDDASNKNAVWFIPAVDDDDDRTRVTVEESNKTATTEILNSDHDNDDDDNSNENDNDVTTTSSGGNNGCSPNDVSPKISYIESLVLRHCSTLDDDDDDDTDWVPNWVPVKVAKNEEAPEGWRLYKKDVALNANGEEEIVTGYYHPECDDDEELSYDTEEDDDSVGSCVTILSGDIESDYEYFDSDDEENDDGEEGPDHEADSGRDDDEASPRNRPQDEENKIIDTLDWRMPPEQSFSDWTIEVTARTSSDDDGAGGEGTASLVTSRYHVHRNVLAIGRKKSGYFEAIFHSLHFQESEDQKSVIDFSNDLYDGKVIFTAMPTFLDYMYSLPSSNIGYDNVLQLQHLARYFIVPSLIDDTKDFIKSDMHNLSHLKFYIANFANNGHEIEDSQDIIADAVSTCVQKICQIQPKSSLLYTMPIAFLMTVCIGVKRSLEMGQFDDDTIDEERMMAHVFNLLLSYASYHRDTLDESTCRGLFAIADVTNVLHSDGEPRYDLHQEATVKPGSFGSAKALLKFLKDTKVDEEAPDSSSTHADFFWNVLVRKSLEFLAVYYVRYGWKPPTPDDMANFPQRAHLHFPEILLKEVREMKAKK